MSVRKAPGGWAGLFLAALLALPMVSCRRPHVDGTVSVDSVLKKWSEGGFESNPVVNIEPDQWSAGACSRGPVAGLDVLICEYASDAAAKVGEIKMLNDWDEEGIPTGAVVRSSNTLFAVADRSRADRSGRTIVRLARLFQSAD